MDLDIVKGIWGKSDHFLKYGNFSEEDIRKMLNGQNHSILNKLVRYEKLGAICPPFFAIYFCGCAYRLIAAGGFNFLWVMLFVVFCMIVFVLNLFRYNKIKKINFATMPVKDFSEWILKYREYVDRCRFWGSCFFLVYMGVYIYLFYKITLGKEIVWEVIITFGIVYLAGFVAIFVIYHSRYYKNIQQIRRNLRKIEMFEMIEQK